MDIGIAVKLARQLERNLVKGNSWGKPSFQHKDFQCNLEMSLNRRFQYQDNTYLSIF